MNRIFRKKLTYQGRVYELPEYLELQLKINYCYCYSAQEREQLTKIKYGRLEICDSDGLVSGRFTFSEAPKFLGVFKGNATYLLNIKIKANSRVIKYFLDYVYAGPNPIMKKISSLRKEFFELMFKDRAKAAQKEHERRQLQSQIMQARKQHFWKKESVEIVNVQEMICYLGKRHFNCDNEHFWYQIKKQLFHIINEN